MSNNFNINPNSGNFGIIQNASLPIYNASSMNGDPITTVNLIPGEILVYNGIECTNEPYISGTIDSTGYTGPTGPTGSTGSTGPQLD